MTSAADNTSGSHDRLRFAYKSGESSLESSIQFSHLLRSPVSFAQNEGLRRIAAIFLKTCQCISGIYGFLGCLWKSRAMCGHTSHSSSQPFNETPVTATKCQQETSKRSCDMLVLTSSYIQLQYPASDSLLLKLRGGRVVYQPVCIPRGTPTHSKLFQAWAAVGPWISVS